MARELFTNNAKSTLASGITDSATSLAVQAGDGALYPDPGSDEFFYVTLDDGTNVEIVKCTSRSTDTLTVERAQQGTSATAFSAGDDVQLRFTAEPAEIIDRASAAGYNQYTSYISGKWYGYPYYNSPASQGYSNSNLRLFPFYCTVTQGFDRIGLAVLTAGSASALIRLGIYETNGAGEPGALLVDGGDVAAATTGEKSITIAETLTRGKLYWIAFQPNEASINVRALSNNDVLPYFGSNAGGANQRFMEYNVSHTYGALPDPAGAVGLSTSSYSPALVRLRAT